VDVIYRREKAKSTKLLQTERELLIGFHQLVAYVLQVRSSSAAEVSAAVSRAELAQLIVTYIAANDPYRNRATVEREVDQLLRESGERLVLLVETRSDQWGFELRSFQ